jgi:hypothetical protein
MYIPPEGDFIWPRGLAFRQHLVFIYDLLASPYDQCILFPFYYELLTRFYPHKSQKLIYKIYIFAQFSKHKLVQINYSVKRFKNSLTAKSCYSGEKLRNLVGFYGRNSTDCTLQHKHNYHKHHHHGGAVCPSYGVGSMDTPDQTRVTSSEGVGREVGRSE